jgi:DNA polymerase III delta prime subunit
MNMATEQSKSKLPSAVKKKLSQPHRFLIYGQEGVGKSTLMSDAPGVIVIDCEDSTADLTIARYPFRDEMGGHIPLCYQDVLDAIEDLTNNPHDFKTLGIDTADRLETLIHRHMLERDSKVCAMNKSGTKLNNVEEYGYGKGYSLALDLWRDLCRRLDQLRMKRGMNIIMLAHANVKPFKNPEGEDYDRFTLRLQEKSAGWLKEWACVTAFACFETGAVKLSTDKNDRPRGASTGKRLLKFHHSAAYDAKTRLALPAEVEINAARPWAPLAKAVSDADNLTPRELFGLVMDNEATCSTLPWWPSCVAAANKALDAADLDALGRQLNWVKGQVEAMKLPQGAQAEQ